jgi:thioredoxin 1
MSRFFLPTLALAALSIAATGQTVSTSFPPLERWRASVLAGDDAGLRALYSSDPPAQVQNSKKQPITLSEELTFWEDLKRNGLAAIKVNLEKLEPGPFSGSEVASFETELELKTSSGPRTAYVVQTQVWSGGPNPRIVAVMRGELHKLQQPLRLNPHLYDPNADARAEIKHALTLAGREHKNVILVFGGNWCYDCHVLDVAFHRPEVAPIVKADYVVVHVDIGEYNKNLDVAEQYDVPLKKGVPALAVLSPSGKLLFSQHGGEFQAARSLAPEDVVAFLNKWKPTR